MQMNRLTIALPLLPGKREAWIRFTQALHGGRRREYEASRRRLGIVRERFWLHEADGKTMAVIIVESTRPGACWPWLVEPEYPFDRWFRRQLRELHGLETGLFGTTRFLPPGAELIAQWTDPHHREPSNVLDTGETQMSIAENRKIVNRAFDELLSQGNLAVADEVYAPTFTDNGEPGGPAYMKQTASMYRAAFPDLTFHIEDQFGSEDKVVSRWRADGTHQGEFMGIPASGNEVTMHGISIHTLQEGQIVAHWSQVTMLSFMQQIGAAPAPDAA